MHKGNSHIPKTEPLSCLAFVVLPCYLLSRHLCGGNFLSTHSTCGAVHKWELCRQRCREETLRCSTASAPSPRALSLCSHNHCQWQSDYWSYNCIKLMLIIWIFYFIFGCWGNLALNQAYVVVFVWVFFFFSFFLGTAVKYLDIGNVILAALIFRVDCKIWIFVRFKD